MTPEERIILDIAAMRLGMDSDDVEFALRIEGLDPKRCSAKEAREAIKRQAPAVAGARALLREVKRWTS